MPIHSPFLSQCVQEAAAQAPGMVERSLDIAVAQLQSAADQDRDGSREQLSQAWRGLLEHKPTWSRDYPLLLRKALSGASAAVQGARPLGPMKLDALSLVDDDHVAGAIETSRLVQMIAPAVEQELSQLDALMSAAAGLDAIQAEANPLRPDAFAQALRELLAQAEPDAQQRALWVRALGKPLGTELKTVYGRIIETLKRADVQEAGYRVRLMAGKPVPPGMPAAAGPAAGPGANAPGSAGVDGPHRLPAMPVLARANVAVGREVLHDFLDRGGTDFDQLLASDYYSAIEDELAAIDWAAAQPAPDEAALRRLQEQYRDLPAVDRPAREVDVGAQFSRQDWGAYAAPHERTRELIVLKKRAVRVAQALGLDVVRTLVNQVARDERLLAPVREAVVALEPALLRLAMAHPRYFRQDDHPARRLVESVTQRSFRYNDEFGTEFAGFFRPVQEAFNDLNAASREDPQGFVSALARLQTEWNEQDQAELQARQQSLASVRFAQQRQALAEQVASDLSRRPDLAGAPAMILDFLYGPWSLVIAHAQLVGQPGRLDPGGYRRAVTDLLWSVKKEVTLKEPGKLFGMVPGLLQTLQAGLDLLGQDREESRPFFDALMRLHNPVLKLRRKAAASQDSGPMPLSPAVTKEAKPVVKEIDETLAPTPEQLKPRKAQAVWLGRHELEQAGFSDTLPTDLGELTELPPADQPPPAPQDGLPGPEAVLAGLREGDWLDLYSKRKWRRVQLSWAGDKGSLFMFTGKGGRPHSMTRRICERLIRENLLRPVDSSAVVDKALHAIGAAAGRQVGEPLVSA